MSQLYPQQTGDFMLTVMSNLWAVSFSMVRIANQELLIFRNPRIEGVKLTIQFTISMIFY